LIAKQGVDNKIYLAVLYFRIGNLISSQICCVLDDKLLGGGEVRCSKKIVCCPWRRWREDRKYHKRNILQKDCEGLKKFMEYLIAQQTDIDNCISSFRNNSLTNKIVVRWYSTVSQRPFRSCYHCKTLIRLFNRGPCSSSPVHWGGRFVVAAIPCWKSAGC